MGMFDNVYDGDKPLVMKCPKCGEDVTGFQSKSGPRELANVDWRLLSNFYSRCRNCDHWLEINVEPPVFTLKMVSVDDDGNELGCLREETVRLQYDHFVVPTINYLNRSSRPVAVPELVPVDEEG